MNGAHAHSVIIALKPFNNTIAKTWNYNFQYKDKVYDERFYKKNECLSLDSQIRKLDTYC